jgi:hypothetical protein
MSEIDELLKISNRGHSRLSGAAKFWVGFTAISVGIGVLFCIALILAAIFMK